MAAVLALRERFGEFLGTRLEGQPLRLELEGLLREPGPVRIDFTGMSITQSFADEFIGPLLTEHGEELLGRLHFGNCSADVRAILELVVGGRLHDIESLQRTQRIQAQMQERRI